MTGQFYINGNDLQTTYKVTVLKSSGELDMPKPKERFEMAWPDDHGLDIDLSEVFFEPRPIEFDCIIQESTAVLAIGYLRSLHALIATGLHQLKSHKTSPRVHMVTLADGIKPERFDSGRTLLFKLRLIEPIPAGKQYTKTGPGSVTFQILTTHPLDIYWGDGTKVLGVMDDNQLTKSFSSGSYTIVVSGAVEKAQTYNVTGATEI